MTADDVEVLTGSRRKQARLMITGVLFVAGGAAIALSGDWVGWLIGGFFAAACVPAALSLARPAQLILDSDGFTVQQWGRRKGTYAWARCGRFHTWSPTPRVHWVSFDYQSPEATTRHPMLTRFNRRLAGGNMSLPDTYGMTASKLRDLLERRQREATTRNR